MPYSWNRPPVPIDKSKQGGRNFDSSKYTDLLKIGTIAAVNSTKVGENNKNLYTNDEEKRRADILISGLQTIPAALCPVCPTTSINNLTLSSTAASALSGITFYVLAYFDTGLPEKPRYSVLGGNNVVVSNTSPTTYLDNAALAFIGASGPFSLPTFTTASSREDIIDALNTIIVGQSWIFPGETDASNLRASLSTNGKIILTIDGPQLPSAGSHVPPFIAGIAFGDGPTITGNGSTTLGATNPNGRCGVDGGALMLTEGQTSVTAPFVIADPSIDFSPPPGGC